MLSAMLPYLVGAGLESRWVVVTGGEEFLNVTKRLHNLLHGFEGDGGDLGPPEARIYAETLAENASRLLPRISAGDVVFVHDPQTAGLIPALKRRGAVVIWHCHIGTETPGDIVRRGWAFLRDAVTPADRYIFSRRDYLWEGLDPSRHRVIRPSIDPFSAKNEDLDSEKVLAILQAADVLAGDPAQSPSFARRDHSAGVIGTRVSHPDGGDAVPNGVPLVLQASRWDRLKDPVGVIHLFAEHLAPRTDAHLVLMGPQVDGVADDPEGQEVLTDSVEAIAALPVEIGRRIHPMCPPADGDQADVIVNAMQRRADVVLQKSLAEGFGLVVSEAMWKARPVVAARVGGIQDQIEDGVSGLLIEDPTDGRAFAGAAARLLHDPARASDIGTAARARVLERFLTPRQLIETVDLIDELI
jgi:trehalose synthase